MSILAKTAYLYTLPVYSSPIFLQHQQPEAPQLYGCSSAVHSLMGFIIPYLFALQILRPRKQMCTAGQKYLLVYKDQALIYVWLCPLALYFDAGRVGTYNWWLNGKESAFGQSRRYGFDLGCQKDLPENEMAIHPVICLGNPHGQRSLVGLQAIRSKKS